jgi:hypothetical protein
LTIWCFELILQPYAHLHRIAWIDPTRFMQFSKRADTNCVL